MILVTGAGGKTGQAVITAAAQQGVPVRALVRRESSATAARQAGAGEIIIGDMTRADTVRQAAEGVQAIYHIAPNMNPQEMHMGQVAIQAAQATGAHLVYHSVLHPHTSAMPHHWHKLRVEELIFTADIPFTILQPTAYMQNLLAYWPAMQASGQLVVPYPPTTRLSLVALQDVAEVAGQVLANPAAHVGATYELVGTAALSQHEVAQVCGHLLGRPISAVELPLYEWEQQAQASGLPVYAIETLYKMFDYYAQYGLAGNANVLGWLLGRAPTTLAEALAG
jgi:NAD(P)H dehydrogenase (quinone)